MAKAERMAEWLRTRRHWPVEILTVAWWNSHYSVVSMCMVYGGLAIVLLGVAVLSGSSKAQATQQLQNAQFQQHVMDYMDDHARFDAVQETRLSRVETNIAEMESTLPAIQVSQKQMESSEAEMRTAMWGFVVALLLLFIGAILTKVVGKGCHAGDEERRHEELMAEIERMGRVRR